MSKLSSRFLLRDIEAISSTTTLIFGVIVENTIRPATERHEVVMLLGGMLLSGAYELGYP